MRQAFQAFLALFGVIVIAISLAHLAIGPRAIIGAVAVNPTVFVHWDRAAVVLTRCASETHLRESAGGGLLRRRDRPVPSFAWAHLGVVLDGTPNGFYLAMLAVELALPPLMVVVAGRVAEPVSV
ncbi:MAG TPA: hypothetical protein VFC01_08105 [Mycobacterium sp.]|nr:hypothetical protein [Mycobacterium sp.]